MRIRPCMKTGQEKSGDRCPVGMAIMGSDAEARTSYHLAPGSAHWIEMKAKPGNKPHHGVLRRNAGSIRIQNKQARCTTGRTKKNAGRFEP